MRISDMHWQQVEAYLAHDDRAVLPLGSTEQHAYLSLSVDSILSERVSVAAAEPLGVPVFPVLAYFGMQTQRIGEAAAVSVAMLPALLILVFITTSLMQRDGSEQD